jgi:chromosome segregation ATPase
LVARRASEVARNSEADRSDSWFCCARFRVLYWRERMADLEKRVDVIQRDVATLKDDVSTLKNDVSTLKEVAVQLVQTVVDQSHRIDAVGNEIRETRSSLEGRLDRLIEVTMRERTASSERFEQFAELEARVTTLEKKVFGPS